MKELTMSSNLVTKLRLGTQQSHMTAENVGFMKCFVKGVVDRECFANFLSNLYYVYTELETALENNLKHPWVAAIYFLELNRKAHLEKDMVFYYGDNWQDKITPLKSTENYISRIHEVSTTDPALLIGHAYTRYMGDLSGGQMFQKVAQSALKLNGYEGTSFYNFEQIPDKKAFKDKYRQILETLPMNDTTAERIVTEANDSFRLTMQMAQELDGSLIKAIGQVLFNSLTGS